MPSFTDAVEKVLKHEGGYVNHKADNGKRTNLGITQKVYEEFIGRTLVGPTTDAIKGQPMSEAESVMRNMSRGNAIAIYKKGYWDKVLGDQIKSYAIAFALFDQAVNRGHVSAVKQAQLILGLNQDGVAGPKLVNAVNSLLAVKGKEAEFLTQYLNASKTFYQTLAIKNPSQAVFLTGWLRRVDSIQSYVNKNMTTVAVVGIGIGTVALFFLALYMLNQNSQSQARRA